MPSTGASTSSWRCWNRATGSWSASCPASGARSARSSPSLDAIARASVAFVAVKENIRFEGRQDLQTKVMTTLFALFALFAEVERDLISERTREGLAKVRASGKKLGRPKGSLGVSRLDGREDEIRHFLNLGVSKSSIAKITGVTRPTLYNFIATRGLQAGA